MRFLGIFSTIVTLIISLVGVAFLQSKQLKIISEDVNTNYEIEEDKNRIFLEMQSKTPLLGFNNLVADWNYLQFIQYFGDTPARKVTGYQLISLYFASIVKDDPRFVSAILMLSSANSLFAVTPKTTVELIDKALQTVTPELDSLTPYLWSYKGTDEMIFLGDIKKAQKSYEMAAQWALKTNSEYKENLAKRNQEIANFLATNPDSKKARVAGWTFILSGGLNEETQKLAIQEIIELGGKVTLTPEGGIKVDFPQED